MLNAICRNSFPRLFLPNLDCPVPLLLCSLSLLGLHCMPGGGADSHTPWHVMLPTTYFHFGRQDLWEAHTTPTPQILPSSMQVPQLTSRCSDLHPSVRKNVKSRRYRYWERTHVSAVVGECLTPMFMKNVAFV